MTLEKTIQYMFDEYPELFQTRKECLNHLFCVIGNGYQWVNGELIEDDCDVDVILDENGKAIQRNLIKKHIGFEWYPLCKEYSRLCTYPEDIKADWMGGIKETIELLKLDGVRL